MIIVMWPDSDRPAGDSFRARWSLNSSDNTLAKNCQGQHEPWLCRDPRKDTLCSDITDPAAFSQLHSNWNTVNIVLISAYDHLFM